MKILVWPAILTAAALLVASIVIVLRSRGRVPLDEGTGKRSFKQAKWEESTHEANESSISEEVEKLTHKSKGVGRRKSTRPSSSKKPLQIHNQQPQGISEYFSTKGILRAIVTFLSIGSILYGTYRPELFKRLRRNQFSDSFEDASKFWNEKYFGKEDLMDEVVGMMVGVVNSLQTLSEEDIKEMLGPAQKNCLLYGPPGTGKTLFVKKAAATLNMYLHLQSMEKQLGETVFRSASRDGRIEEAKKRGCVVRIIFVQPSMLEGKWIGETEKNVRDLFEAAIDGGPYQATIIFIDEADAFLSKRLDTTHEATIRLQSELLNRIGGSVDNLMAPMFIFASTNRYDVIDDAFKRRFTPYELKLPDREERKEILELYLQGCGVEVMRRCDELAEYTDGWSQARIADTVKAMRFAYYGKMDEIPWDEVSMRFGMTGGGTERTEVTGPRQRRLSLLDPAEYAQ